MIKSGNGPPEGETPVPVDAVFRMGATTIRPLTCPPHLTPWQDPQEGSSRGRPAAPARRSCSTRIDAPPATGRSHPYMTINSTVQRVAAFPPGGVSREPQADGEEVNLHRSTDDMSQDIIQQASEMQNNVEVRGDSVRISALAIRGIDKQTIEVDTVFPRRFQADRRPRDIIIHWSSPKCFVSLDKDRLGDYMQNGRISYEKAKWILRGHLNMSKDLQRFLIPEFDMGLNSFDYIGLFTVGWLIYDYKSFLERNGVNAVVGNVPADIITYCNVSDRANNAAEPISTLKEAFNIGRIILPGQFFSESDISVLAALALGPAFFRVAANNDNFVHSLFRTDPIYWLVWYAPDTDEPYIPNITMVDAFEILCTIKKLALKLEAGPDLVRAFVRANTLLSGRLSNSTASEQHFFLGTLEIEKHNLPYPKGTGVVWSLLNHFRFGGPETGNIFAQDYDKLVHFQEEELISVGAIVGATVSIATSSVLDAYNMDGTKLNMYANRGLLYGHVPTHNNIFNHEGERPVVCVSDVACNVVYQLTGWRVSWRCFVSLIGWCSSFLHRRDLASDAGWQHEWGQCTPYVTRPEVLEWITKWLSVWGLRSLFPYGTRFPYF